MWKKSKEGDHFHPHHPFIATPPTPPRLGEKWWKSTNLYAPGVWARRVRGGLTAPTPLNSASFLNIQRFESHRPENTHLGLWPHQHNWKSLEAVIRPSWMQGMGPSFPKRARNIHNFGIPIHHVPHLPSSPISDFFKRFHEPEEFGQFGDAFPINTMIPGFGRSEVVNYN